MYSGDNVSQTKESMDQTRKHSATFEPTTFESCSTNEDHATMKRLLTRKLSPSFTSANVTKRAYEAIRDICFEAVVRAVASNTRFPWFESLQ